MNNRPAAIPAETLRIIELARWAPSSHNTQPWLVRISGNRISIYPDSKRHLKVGDPKKRELFMSLGCFIETAITAAKSIGRDAEFDFVGKDKETARLIISPERNKQDDELAGLITNRRSDRRNFEEKPLGTAIQNRLSSLKQGLAKVHLITEPDDVNFLGDMTYEATVELMSPAAFRAELASWIRHNWTRRPDGMPGYTQGIPGPVSLIGPKLIKNVPKTAKDQAKKDANRVRQAPAAVLITAGVSRADWLDAGRLFQRFWLEATGAGLRASAISPAVISAETSQQIKKRFNLGSDPVALLRLGYSRHRQPKASPRRRTEQIIEF
jgi:hypothetical protein